MIFQAVLKSGRDAGISVQGSKRSTLKRTKSRIHKRVSRRDFSKESSRRARDIQVGLETKALGTFYEYHSATSGALKFQVVSSHVYEYGPKCIYYLEVHVCSH